MTARADQTELDDVDRELLNAVQWDFPLEPRPYAVLGERLGISEPEVRERIAKVKDDGVLRQLSAIFDTRALGYTSALVAAKIDPDHVDEAAEIVSRHPGVSHNYKRNHAYNLWYTIAVPPGTSLDEHIDVLHRESGALAHAQAADAEAVQDRREARHDRQDRGEREDRGARARAPGAQGRDARARALRSRARGDPHRRRTIFPTSSDRSPSTPPRSVIDESTVIDTIRSLKERKLMRRFAAVMNHRNAGFKANAMGVWAVPDDQLEEIGPQMATFSAVSHCYRRPTYDDWPYSVFTMVHGRSARECEATIEAIRDETGIGEYCLLWSVKEYKKIRLRYFGPEWDDWEKEHLARSAP